MDYALSAPIPWKAPDCLGRRRCTSAGVLRRLLNRKRPCEADSTPIRPFVLLAQPSLFDNSRAPAGKHTAWAYCHVPNGSKVDMLQKLEDQIERFAPGFRDCVLARRVFSPADLESMDANLVGGDIGGGIMDLRNFLFPADAPSTTPLQRRTFISAPHPLLQAAECMACAVITRRKWR